MVIEISRLDRFRGAMLGMAVGDALGAPLNGMKPGHMEQVYGGIAGFVDAELAWKGKPHRWSLRGLYTGATQQALAVADILAADGRCSPRALADVFVEMANLKRWPGGCHRRVDREFLAVLDRMRSGKLDPVQCGEPIADLTAAIRAVPIGLFHSGDPETLRQTAVECALPTHRDPRAVAAGAAVVSAVAAAARGDLEGARGGETARRIAEEARKAEDYLKKEHWSCLADFEDPSFGNHISESLTILVRLLEEGDDKLAWDSIVRQANRCSPDPAIREPGSAFAPAGILSALYLALGGRTLIEAMPIALTIGRESSQIGAIVGAVIGARDGVKSIPPDWISGLRNADQIRLRADNLERGEIDYTRWRGIVDLESEAKGEEERERQRWKALWEKQGLLPNKPKRPPKKKEPDPGFAPPPELWLDPRGKPRARRRENRWKEKRGRS